MKPWLRRVATDQSADRSAHSKEVQLLDQSFLKLIGQAFEHQNLPFVLCFMINEVMQYPTES